MFFNTAREREAHERRIGETRPSVIEEEIAAHRARQAHERFIREELSKIGEPIPFEQAAKIAGTHPLVIASNVTLGNIAGDKRKRTVSLGSLEAWTETRNRA